MSNPHYGIVGNFCPDVQFLQAFALSAFPVRTLQEVSELFGALEMVTNAFAYLSAFLFSRILIFLK